MEALDAAAGLIAYACDACSVAGAVRPVDLLDYRFAHRSSCLSDAAGRLHARDGDNQARAGNPEARRHLARPLVLDDARQAERAAGRDTERARPTPELPCHSLVVFEAVGHQLLFSCCRLCSTARSSSRWRQVIIEYLAP